MAQSPTMRSYNEKWIAEIEEELIDMDKAFSKESSLNWRTLIKSAKDLQTRRESTRQGFIDQAYEKSKRAITIENHVHDFMLALKNVRQVEDLLDLNAYWSDLIAAASYSLKAWGYAKAGETSDQQKARLRERFVEIYERCKNETTDEECCLTLFRERILFRSLLTQGESLGGSMRNWIGRVGADSLVEAIQTVLAGQGTTEYAKRSTKVQRIRWENRLLLFDTKPTLHIKGERVEVTLSSSSEEEAETSKELPLNNIDMILLDTSHIPQAQTMWGDSLPLNTEDLLQAEKGLLKNPGYYLACGELKSGNDPAGGDEHWKTAWAAFDRIRNPSSVTKDFQPELFFVGRAIEAVMATNIFERLESGVFSFAANLSNPQQVAGLAQWLTTL